MDYQKWSEQYYIQEISLKNYIKKLKNDAKVKGPTDAGDIYYRISILYSMYLEVKHIGKYLKGLERRERNEE